VPLQAGPYVPAKGVQAAVKVTRLAQVGALTAYFLGESLFQPSPRLLALLASAQENRFPLAIGLYLSHLACELAYSTSAFEVTFNGKKVFSKLEEGRFPQPGELPGKLSAIISVQKPTEEESRDLPANTLIAAGEGAAN